MQNNSIKFKILKPIIAVIILGFSFGCRGVSNFITNKVIPNSKNYSIELNDGPNRYIYGLGTAGAQRPCAIKINEEFIIKAGEEVERKHYPIQIKVDIGEEDLPRHLESYSAKIQFSKPGVEGIHLISGKTTFTRIDDKETVGYFTASDSNLNAGFTVELIKHEE